MGGALPPLACSSVACVLEDFRPFPAERPQFEPVLCAGVSIGPNACAGYPSLFSRPLHVPVLSKANLEMFGRRSRRESLCLRFADSVPLTSSIAVDNGMLSRTDVKSQIAQDCKLELVAKTLLGNACFVSWPHWRPGVLMAMTDGKKRVTRDSQGKLCVHVLTPQEKSQHEGARKSQHTEWLQVNFLKSRFHNELGKRVEHSLLRNSHSELP